MPALDEELDQTVQLIWSTMFDLPMARVNPDRMTADSPLVTGFVILEGEFDGAILVRCPQGLAVRLTDIMFGSEGPPAQSDIRDAIGELANMMAGNIKAVLPHPSRIGLPVVAFGNDYQLQVLGTVTAARVAYDFDGDVLTVTLVRQVDEERRNDDEFGG